MKPEMVRLFPMIFLWIEGTINRGTLQSGMNEGDAHDVLEVGSLSGVVTADHAALNEAGTVLGGPESSVEGLTSDSVPGKD